MNNLKKFWYDEAGQDIAEYAVVLAVILVLVVGTIRLVGSNASATNSLVLPAGIRSKGAFSANLLPRALSRQRAFRPAFFTRL
jgi:Flp pilus assembly pilin Flp